MYSLRFFSLVIFLWMISLPAISLAAEEIVASSPASALSNASTNLSLTTDATSTNNESITNNEKTDTNATVETATSAVPVDPSVMPPSDPSSNTDTNESVPNDPNALPSTSPDEAVVPMNSTESIEKKKEQIKVRYYQVRTQVEKEEAVISLRFKADKAASDEEKRQALRAYYDLLFQRMRKIDPSLSDRCDTMQAAYLRHLEQVCIEPSIPLNPPPVVNDVAAPSATPLPTPSGKKNLNKKKLITTTKSQS